MAKQLFEATMHDKLFRAGYQKKREYSMVVENETKNQERKIPKMKINHSQTCGVAVSCEAIWAE